MKKLFYILFLVSIVATSCNVQRFLPAGERLYKGASIKIEKIGNVKGTTTQLSKKIKLAVKPKTNKFLFGQPYKVWWWYKLGALDPEKQNKGLRSFLKRKLGEPPVLSSRVNVKATAENMAAFMENLGYFHTTVQGDTTNFGYFTKAIYTAQVHQQYIIKDITWVSDSTNLLKLLEAEQKKGILKPGLPYRLSDITGERDRLDLYLKTKGYYYFNPDYIMAYADSTIGNHEVNLLLNIKKTIPAQAKKQFTINRITVFPNYSLVSQKLDTSRLGAQKFDGLTIKDPEHKFKPTLFSKTITYRPGSVYSSKNQNTSLNRLINLGAFKFVKNRFQPTVDSNSSQLNVYYFLTPAKKKSVQAEIDAFSKENNSIGSQLSVNWKNRNLFGGAEALIIKAYGGFEVSTADSLRNNNSMRLGGEVTLKVPKYVLPPFIKIKESFLYPPNTNLILGYELYRKQLFYTKNLFRFNYEFTWKKNIKNLFTLAPIALSYLNASQITDSFNKAALINPTIKLNVFSEAILGTYATYTYRNAIKPVINNWVLNAGIDLSGNIAGLITGAKTFREKTILKTPFAQYVKLDLDIHYTRALTNKWDWANRFQIGLGMPYKNSAFLPFAKQYIIGGSSSIRGFRVRSIGPGTYKPTAEDQRFFQIIGGDYKLLMNTELRIPLSPKISGAVFADMGNIWTKDTLIFGPLGKFTKNWPKELAVATGVGLRFDAIVLLIRADLGIPLRKPFLPEGQRWVFNQIEFGSGPWRRENLILNIAFGYPF